MASTLSPTWSPPRAAGLFGLTYPTSVTYTRSPTIKTIMNSTAANMTFITTPALTISMRWLTGLLAKERGSSRACSSPLVSNSKSSCPSIFT